VSIFFLALERYRYITPLNNRYSSLSYAILISVRKFLLYSGKNLTILLTKSRISEVDWSLETAF